MPPVTSDSKLHPYLPIDLSSWARYKQAAGKFKARAAPASHATWPHAAQTQPNIPEI